MTSPDLTKPIDVLFIRNMRSLSQPTGGEVYLVNLARSLSDVGVRPHFLFAVDSSASQDIALDLFREAGFSFDVVEVSSTFSLADLRKAKAVIKDRKPDLVHSIDHRADMIGALLHQKCLPVASFLGWTAFTPGSFKWIVYGTLDRLALRRMKMIFYDSKLMTQNLGALAQSPKLRYVPNGVDSEKFVAERAAFSEGQPATFIQIARFHPNKGQLDFVRAAHLAGQRHPGLKFILVGNAAPGDEDYEKQVRDYVAQNNVENVEFTGPVPHSALVGLLSRADALVAPSHLEGLSYAVLEAMAMGRVPICYDTGGLSEALTADENGLVVAPGNIDALANCFIDLQEDRARGQRLSTAARTLILERYSLHAMAKGVVAGYREVLAQHRSASGR